MKSKPGTAAGLGAAAVAAVVITLVAGQQGATAPKVALTRAVQPLVRTEPARPPEALQQDLDRLAAAHGEPVGIAVAEVGEDWIAGVDPDGLYPQQSVSKLWVALAVLRAADAGQLDLDGWVTLRDEDRSVFYQPVAYNIGPAGYTTQISSLLRRAIVQSDNAANDRLMREAGGPDRVSFTLAELGLQGVTVGAYERDLQSLVAGLTWRPEYGTGWNFQAAREQLPRQTRETALESYLENPLDGAQPAGIVRALARLHQGDLLSRDGTERLLGLMTDVRTGPRRLKGGLPPGWRIAHKTGTGQDYRGASIGINDVGLLTAPDGRTYAVAVLMRRTRKPIPERMAFMQAVSRAVVAEWSRSGDGPAPGVVVADR